jgi:hypothetical protein
VVDDTGDEVAGCPLNAAELAAHPFNQLAFVERDAGLADALETRLRAPEIGPDRAKVILGDANDKASLAEALAFLPRRALVFVFIDPEASTTTGQRSSSSHSARTPGSISSSTCRSGRCDATTGGAVTTVLHA